MNIEKLKSGRTGPEKNRFLRTCRIEIRVAPDEYQVIQNNSIASGYSTTAFYVRDKALSSSKQRSTQKLERSQFLNDIARVGNNLNQIAKHLNLGNKVDSDILDEILETKMIFEYIKDKLKG
jgi:hypothetical protein